MDQAQRRVPRPPGKATVTFPSPAEKAQPVAGEERLAILRMLEQGKINVDQAEQLLHALEDKT